MDVDFKIPSNEPKIKFVSNKVTKLKENENVEAKKELDLESETIEAIGTSNKPSVAIEKRAVTASNCPYIEPKWSRKPESNNMYSLDVLKSGTIVETINKLQNRAFWTIGKLADNHIVMAHPTISRYHAILQYRPQISNKIAEKGKDENNAETDVDANNEDTQSKQGNEIEMGWYLYDLGSTHGCFVNKMKIPPKTYFRIRVGYMFQFGASTRKYILQGPEFDQEAESALSITEMKDLRLKQEQHRQEQLILNEQKKEAEGINWGMSEDADEETDLSQNPYAATNNEELFLQDPKKTLRGFFEREGFDLEYKVDEMSAGTFICRIELPVTDASGRNITAEVCHKGKKKECVLQCALEACRILDRQGVLRQSQHEPQKRKRAKSSDDDEFYDRTTEAEEKRKRKAGNEETHALSYNELLTQEKQLQEHLTETEQKILKYQELDKLAKQQNENEDDEDLDNFMSHLLAEKQLDKTEIRKLRFELQRITNDLAKVKRLINLTQPIDLPPLQVNETSAESKPENVRKKLAFPLFGKKGTFGFGKLTTSKKLLQTKSKKIAETATNAAEEFDEDEEMMQLHRESLSAEAPTNAIAMDKPELVQSKQSKCDTLEMLNKTVSLGQEMPKVNISTAGRENPTRSRNSKDLLDSDATISSEILENNLMGEVATRTDLEATSKISNRRKRNRNRNRGEQMRDNIDIDDTEEVRDTEKYASWMPPENQAGDGITDLNSKYGY